MLTIGGNLTVNGGLNYLSRIGGKLTSTINGNLTLTGGNLIVKGDIGNATLTVNGVFSQSGGKLFHHSNYVSPTSDIVSVIVNGDFNQSSGTINFDDCPSSSAAHSLVINGGNYNLSGTGSITRTGAASYGNICFGRQGITQFNRLSNSHSIRQVQQYIKSGCTLNVNTGNIQLASSDSSGLYFMTIQNGGVLNMNSRQLFSNALAAFSAINVASGATLITACAHGLYDGTTAACINASSGLSYYLDPNSTVEYNGSSNQVVTGIGMGLATTSNQKYGILRINFNGIAGTNYVYPVALNIYVRTRLELAQGEFNLNGNELTIESGLANAITRINGYIKSKTNAAYNPSIITWKNLSGGDHIFPFGVSPSGYVPVTFTPLTGMGGNVSVSTRATSSPDNTPLPDASPVVSSAVTLDNSYAVSQVIDRWWNITANGFTANVTLSYLGSENTMNDSCAKGKLQVNRWSGSNWGVAPCNDNGVTSGTGTVTINNTSLFSAWMVTGQLFANSPLNTTESSADDLIIQSLGPNPFISQLSIVFTLYQDGPVYVQLSDLTGKLFFSETVDGVAGSNTYSINSVSSLSSGAYILSLSYHGTVTARKVIKN